MAELTDDELRDRVRARYSDAALRMADRDAMSGCGCGCDAAGAEDGACCTTDAARTEVFGGGLRGRPRPPAVSCALDAAALEARLGRWRRLADRALLDSAPTTSGLRLRLRLRGEAEVEDEVRALIAAEGECCPALGFVLARTAGDLVLEISGPVELLGLSPASSPSPRS